jgi:tetratricopeptide (TPR) repeat protein
VNEKPSQVATLLAVLLGLSPMLVLVAYAVRCTRCEQQARAAAVRGEEAEAADQLDDAIAAYRLAVSLAPRNAQFHIALAGVLAARGIAREAHEQYAEAIQIDPANPQAFLNEGVLYASRQRWPQAAEAFRRTLELSPNSPMALVNLAQVYVTATDPALHQPAQALELVAKAVEATGQNDVDYLEAAAHVSEVAGKPELAAKYRQSAERAAAAVAGS